MMRHGLFGYFFVMLGLMGAWGILATGCAELSQQDSVFHSFQTAYDCDEAWATRTSEGYTIRGCGKVAKYICELKPQSSDLAGSEQYLDEECWLASVYHYELHKRNSPIKREFSPQMSLNDAAGVN